MKLLGLFLLLAWGAEAFVAVVEKGQGRLWARPRGDEWNQGEYEPWDDVEDYPSWEPQSRNFREGDAPRRYERERPPPRDYYPRDDRFDQNYPDYDSPSSYGSPQYEPNSNSPDQERAIAAGLGTGALGFLVGGPVGAAVLGFSSAFCAENVRKNTVVGDSARAIGDVALAAGRKGVELNEKHHVVDRTVEAAGEAWERAKEMDQEYRLVQKAKEVALYGSTATVDFVRKNNLVERGFEGLGRSIGWVSDKVAAGSLDGGEDAYDKYEDQGPPPQRRRMRNANPPGDSGRNLMPSTPYDRYNSRGRSSNFDRMPMDVPMGDNNKFGRRGPRNSDDPWTARRPRQQRPRDDGDPWTARRPSRRM